jgi:hypothetical protein
MPLIWSATIVDTIGTIEGLVKPERMESVVLHRVVPDFGEYPKYVQHVL